MRLVEWVSYMIGIDLSLYPQYDYLVIGVACALLIILFSSVYTLLLTIGGMIAPRKY